MSLVEVVFALLLAGLGLTAVAATSSMAARVSGSATAAVSSVALARVLLDSLVTVPDPVAGAWEDAHHTATWSVQPAPAGTSSIVLDVVGRAGRDTLRFRALAAAMPPRID